VDLAAVLGGLLLGAWIFWYKMKAYRQLCYTSDLFVSVQLATTWLDGRFLEDNAFGNSLSIHSYLFTPVLGILAGPFGAPGLLLALALAVGFACVLSARILRVLGVPGVPAAALGFVIVASPYSVGTFHNPIYGFHVELLAPTMALWLLYQLLQRHWTGSLAAAITLLSVKEEMPLLCGAVAGIVLIEDLLGGKERWRERLNRPALVVMLLSAVAFPLLLGLIAAQPPSGELGGLALARPPGAEQQPGTLLGLIQLLWHQKVEWLGSDTVGDWMRMGYTTTFGLALLRFHHAPLGLPLTLVAWLTQSDLLWPPRWAASLAFLWSVTLLALGSLWYVVSVAVRAGGWKRLAACAVCCTVALGSVWSQRQSPLFERAYEVYTLAPSSPYERRELAQADALFANYQKLAGRAEPAVASPWLFRYVDVQNLYWIDRLGGRPRPHWILGDATFSFGRYDLPPASYELLGRDGQFVLYRMRGTGDRAP
jgi:predicted membrane protein DUF2079